MKRIFTLSAVCLGFLAATIALAAAGGGGGGRGRGGGAAAAAGPRGPAPTLTAPATLTTTPDEDGFIRRWILLEPIPAQGVAENSFRAVVKKQYFTDQLTVIPHDGDKVTVDGAELTWHACDTSRYNVNLYHFSYALNKPTSGVFWWAVTVVHAREEIKDVRLAVGSNDASIWWLNGEELIGLFNNRMDTIDDGVSKKVTLKKGVNILRAAICNEMGPTDFCARFLDTDEKPLKNITVSLSDAAN